MLLVPTGEAPHKRIEADPGPKVRLEMTRLAVEGDDRFEVTSREVEREGPSYMHETLEELVAEEPQRELFLVIGADAALGLGSWRNPDRILGLARLAVAPRVGADRMAVEAALEELGAGERVEFLELPELAVSSSLIRDRVAANRPLRYLVPERVAELIEARGLYR